jgi:hypothetical protein
MQNRLNLILETVANLLMELSPETYASAAEKSHRRTNAYEAIRTGERKYSFEPADLASKSEIGLPYNQTKPFPFAIEPRDARHHDFPKSAPAIRGISEPVTKKGLIDRINNEDRRELKFANRARREFGKEGKSVRFSWELDDE